MQSNRRNQSQEFKQWKQQWKVNARKLDQFQKSSLKILSTFSQVNPQSAAKTNSIISDYDASVKKGQKQSQNVYGKLRKINQSVQQLRETLKYFDKTNQSLMKVQKLSQGIFGKMQTLKNQMATSYDQLDELQQKYSNDLDLMDRRIARFDQEGQEEQKAVVSQNKAKNKQNLSVQNHHSSKQINKKSDQKKKKQQSDEEIQQPLSRLDQIQLKMKAKQDQVQKVDEQIRDLGKFLGWHQQDHKDFLTIWNRNQPNKNYFEIQDELVEYFKMYTNEQIIDHMNKYVKFKKLNDKKKYLINQYKQLKEEKRAEQVLKLKSYQQEKQIKIRKQEQIKKSQQQQRQMKEKVQLWKKQKKQMQNQQRQKAIQEQQRKKKEQINRRREQQAKRKQIIDQWKVQQEQKQKQQKQKQKKQPARRPQSAANKQTRDRIRERQQQIIRQKMQKAIQKKMEKQELQKKAQRIRQQKLIKYAHVNSKLQQKTAAIKQKQREKFDGKNKKDANTFGGQLLLTGVRAIPEWRQGM